ncbi:MAG: ATP-binding protein, partial [Pseudomonadota bacterium]|nr:ATP-binding protein [Pseudomonadota bacterium]
ATTASTAAAPGAAAGKAIGSARATSAGTPSEADHEALGTLVSHDLRAPIRVVEGFTRIVKEDYANVLDRVGHDHLDRVLGAAGRMNHMIDALLGLSRLAAQPIVRVPVDLSQLAAYVVEDLRRLHPEHPVEVEIEPGMTELGDPTLLRQVLENLLGNAWKYTGNTSRPHVAFVRDDSGPAGYVVRDNGAGFDMRYADRLFGVFQRLHSASEFPGTGVGLASVRRIVHRHGGEIRAEGEPEHGASFYFSLSPDPAVA